jgi:hypothetical protein
MSEPVVREWDAGAGRELSHAKAHADCESLREPRPTDELWIRNLCGCYLAQSAEIEALKAENARIVRIMKVPLSVRETEAREAAEAQAATLKVELNATAACLHTYVERAEALREALITSAAALAAAISLLERGGKKAASSDKMFAQILDDYRKALGTARAALAQASQP